MTTFLSRASKEMVALAPEAPHSKTRTWAGRCLPTPRVVSKVVMAAILDPPADSRKEAMRRQRCGMFTPLKSGFGCSDQHDGCFIHFFKTFIKQH